MVSNLDFSIKTEQISKFFRRQILPIEEEIKQYDRIALDNIFFDAIGLTEIERKEIYYAACELVQKRLEKAKNT